jgi:hypothetical protein
MATATRKITLGASCDIPFNKLLLSQFNVRRVKAGISIEEFAEDIARRSLLQSLNVRPVLDANGDENAVGFRRGWFLGDDAGAGKNRQVAGILLDNWLKGRRRALWVSKSDKLIEDAQRDWSALGQERLLITPLGRFRQGTPIRLDQGILFATYATLRSDAREEKLSRVQQIVEWLGRDFDGMIVFDESYAMQNAAGEKSERGEQAPSQRADGIVDRLKAINLISEIISWKLRLLVPTGASGPSTFARVMERHPLVCITDKATA